MAAYMIFIREGAVFDQAAIDAYSRANRASAATFRERYDLTPLSVYGTLETVEGAPADGVVLMTFPDMATARAWYDSPEYQASIPLRQAGAAYRALLFEGL